MKETKASHTPGPWHVDEFVFASNGLRIADPYCDEQDMPDAEVSANARLIAAAPELLDALQAVFNELSADSRSISSYLTPATVQLVRNALLKSIA